MHFMNFELPFLPESQVIWCTTRTHSQTSARYQHEYQQWLYRSKRDRCTITIHLSFHNSCPSCRSPKSFDAPLEHILKRQLASKATMWNDYWALVWESLRMLPESQAMWCTTRTHSQTSARYQHEYQQWLYRSKRHRCTITIHLSFHNICASWQSPKSFGAPLEHILKRRLATNMNI